MSKKEVKSWDDISDDFDRMNNMVCKPSFKKLPKDFVTDEDKSVKWNREQVEKNNKDYQDEVARLNTEKNKARTNIYKDIYAKIQEEVGHNINEAAARKIWDYAYGKGHSYGIQEIMIYLDDIMELIKDVLKENN